MIAVTSFSAAASRTASSTAARSQKSGRIPLWTTGSESAVGADSIVKLATEERTKERERERERERESERERERVGERESERERWRQR